MPKKTLTGLLSVLLLILAPLVRAADELRLPERPQAAAPTQAPVPARGMSIQRVEQEFGAPLSRRGPVGEPPIRVWSYAGFRVYFETDRVIHSVRDSDLSAHGLTAPPAPEAARPPRS